MGRKKPKTEKQLLYEKRSIELQDCQRPRGESNRHIIKTHYMLNHINYIRLDLSAKVALDYMIDWAFGNDEFLKTGSFPFSITMLRNIGVMSSVTSTKALRQLESYGFIKKTNNATFQSGITQMWTFSNDWQNGEKPYK